MSIRLQYCLGGTALVALALVLSVSGAAQTDEGPPPIGDMSVRRVVVHDLAVFADAVVTSLSFTPGSDSLVCGLDDGRVLLLDLPDGMLLREFAAHGAEVTSVSCSPDGRWLASSGADGWVHVTDLVDGSNVLSLAHQGVVYETEFSPEGTYLGSAGEECRVRLWEVSTWNERPAIVGHTGAVFALAFSPAEDLIVSGAGGSDPTVRLWDLATGAELRRDLYEGIVHDVEYSPRLRDRHATISGTQGTIWLWEVDRGEFLHLVGSFRGAVTDAAYSSAGNTLVAVSEDRTLFFTTMPSWTERRRFTFDEPLVAVAFSGSRQYIACSDSAGHLYLLFIPP